MANRDTAMGARLNSHFGGGTPNRVSQFTIADEYDTDIFSGDFVSLGTGTNVEAVTEPVDFPAVGVFLGCEYRKPNGSVVFSPYWPANTDTMNDEGAKAYVLSDPDTVFEIQSDGATSASDVGSTASISYTAGRTSTGVSAVELDHSTIGTGDNLYIIGIKDAPDNYPGEENVQVLVVINEHAYTGEGEGRFA
jgi:hypothetical protein